MAKKEPCNSNDTVENQEHPNHQKYHLIPLMTINDFDVRPGFYNINGATAIPGGVNFTIHTANGTGCTLLLFKRESKDPPVEIPFPEDYKIGHVYSMIVFAISIYNFEYAYRVSGPCDPQKGLIFNERRILLDPYAKAVTGQSIWGVKQSEDNYYRARVVRDDFDWGQTKQSLTPMEDLIIYEMHVRGFTKDVSSKVENPGTFKGIEEKIPYLKELGINAIELMPIFEFDEMLDAREYKGNTLCNYWGYNTVSFFAPNTSYTASTEYNQEGNEFKSLIRALKDAGIEVILDVVFNHTAEGNENGPYISFKGFDNNVYYLLTPQGFYYNFSGCGNTLNCNHPIVQQMILECLRYWVIMYRVDGFRFDLASILGRNEDGSPMNQPPLLQSLAYDPILGSVKLIAEAWDAGGLYQIGMFSSLNDRWAEWNGRYRDDIRKFLKGDKGMLQNVAYRMNGSPDIYHSENHGDSSVNFITCHDGFTLYDLYSYNEKHNEMNGWNNQDGMNENDSWNCGIEGDTNNKEVIKLRKKMIKNACAVLMCSHGTPMFLAGDEFCNTQYGNNNPYCQDNKISWLDWNLLKKNKDIFAFFKKMIQFRKEHTVLHRELSRSSMGFPAISYHGVNPWKQEFSEHDLYLGIMFAGRENIAHSQDDIIYVAINSYWEDLVIKLPQLQLSYQWKGEITTAERSVEECCDCKRGTFTAEARSVTIFLAKKLQYDCIL